MPPLSPLFEDEAERLRVFESFSSEVLEDDPELTAIVEFAARLCEVPASMVSMVGANEQTFLAREGLEERGTPKDVSFCVHALASDNIMEVRDATQDERFADNPLVTGPPNVRFYAGHPLVSEEGAPLGTLCVIDQQAREDGLSDFQRQGLSVLAQAAMRRLRGRREELQAARAIAVREQRLRRTIDALPQIAWSASEEGVFDYFNARWKQETGAEPPVTMEDWRPFIHPEDVASVLEKWSACIANGTEFEVEFRLRHADDSWTWVLALAVPVDGEKDEESRWFGSITDIDEGHRLSESRDMLARELSHRIKNIFAVVIGLIALQARKEPEHKVFANRLSDVLRALGRAHDFVRPASGATRQSLKGLLDVLFAPYVTDDGDPRITVSGAEADISARAATPMALVFHELATNSAKYGALSVEDGHVTLELDDRDEQIALLWREHGGPAVDGSGETGFGSRMVEMAVTGQLMGSWERRFEPGGMEADIALSKEAIAK